MNTIFALRGPGGCGKSSSISAASDLLRQEASVIVVYEEVSRSVDVFLILQWKGIRIGIESRGDPNSRLAESLARFRAEGCQVIVCATRTSGMTEGWVKELADSYQIVWIDKERVADTHQKSANHETARDLVERIRNVVSAEAG